MDNETVQSVLEVAPTLGLVFTVLALGAGVVLWALGGKLARPACAVGGLVLLGLVAFEFVPRLTTNETAILVATIVAAIVGGVLAAMLFRLWMAISAAALMALLVPAAGIVWSGAVGGPLPADGDEAPYTDTNGDRDEVSGLTAEQTSEALENLARDVTDRILNRGDDGESEAEDEPGYGRGGDASGEGADSQESEAMASLVSTLREAWEARVQTLRAWWDGLSARGRTVIVTGGLIAAGVGLVFGLLAPYAAAAFQTVVLSGPLILFPARELIRHFLDAQPAWLPDSPRATLLTLGLITLAGLVFQWTMLRRPADK